MNLSSFQFQYTERGQEGRRRGGRGERNDEFVVWQASSTLRVRSE